MPTVCQDIVALSDEETEPPVPGGSASSSSRAIEGPSVAHVTSLSDEEEVRDRPQKRKAKEISYAQVRSAVIRSLNGSCQCRRVRADKRNCLDAFRGRLDDITSLRVKLLSLHKLDMDEEVLGLPETYLAVRTMGHHKDKQYRFARNLNVWRFRCSG